ncbi:hypothetical protein GCM10027062_26090 [Nocardioides hungaricus]
MSPRRTSFVTLCQQLLALGVVIAALTPAASVVSLDVVRETPGASGGPALGGSLAAYTKRSAVPSRVSTEVVDPTVEEYALTAPAGTKSGTKSGALRSVSARSRTGELGGPEVVSLPQPVSGYGTIGVTWASGEDIPDEDLDLAVRTRTGDTWSEWMDLEYTDDHAADPGTEEGKDARPGTDALLIGEVDEVQVRVSGARRLPADMRLAVIDPGTDQKTAVERPALDTSTMDDGTGEDSAEPAEPDEPTDDGLGLSAATYTPKPQIFSRAQWGADESMRDKGSLSYFEVHAGFVHHTVNANNYTRAQVPALLRGIYAYHTQSRGWSDIGYNFLVDRFGRIWEGRAGGVDRPVVGAHTLNYNDYSFAMSAIGNYETAKPTKAVIQAYAALFAWKLSLHGVDASSKRQWVGSRYFQAINGHRDAASTACPGRYLYAKIPQIRKLAAAAQKGWDGRNLESNLAGSGYPDLIVRRASDGKGVILPTGGLTGFGAGLPAASGIGADDKPVVSPDLTGDGYGDLLVVSPSGSATVRPGDGNGGFGASVRTVKGFGGHDLVTAVGDLNADGRNDLVARRTSDGRLDVYLGRSGTRFRLQKAGTGWDGYTQLIGAGDADGDGRADLIGRDRSGTLWLHPGNGKGGFGAPVKVPGSFAKYSTITGYGDFDKDGDTDLFAREAGSKNGWVLPSNGDGSYGRPLGPVLRIATVGGLVGAAQVSSDGTPDLVGRTRESLVTFPNAGTTEVGRPIVTNLNLKGANLVLNAGDWDRDGRGDVIVRSKKTGALKLRRGDGTGTFAKPIRLPGNFKSVGLLAAVGDMTGDGFPDLMGQPAGGAMRIYPGAGTDGLRPSYVAHSRIDAGKQIAVGRWNGDGAPDSLFRKGNRLTLYPGNGPGGLTGGKALGLDLSPYDWVVGISDVMLTGHADLLVRERKTGDLYLIQGTETGFQPRRYLASGMGAYDLAG